MVRFRMLESVFVLSLVVTSVRAQVTPHKVVPLNKIPSEHWIEVVSGDPIKAGSAFVIRLHNDAGYVCPPHTHPTDENIVVVQGSWSVGMGTRINLSTVQPLALGAYALVPAKMAHFCRSTTETIIQVHGVGPFTVDMVDPLHELTDKSVNRIMSMGAPAEIVRDYPSSCFTFNNRGPGNGRGWARHGRSRTVFTGEWLYAVLGPKDRWRAVLGASGRGAEKVDVRGEPELG